VLTIADVHFQPWVGSEYERSTHRLLLVGEGHYLDQTELRYDTPTLTQEIICRVRDGTQVLPFYTRTASTVIGTAHFGPEDRSKFWNRVAFYNYVPMVAGSKARERPSAYMWTAAIAPFCSVLTSLQPRCVLVLGQGVWNAIQLGAGWSSNDGEQKEKAIRLWHSPDRNPHFATWIAHPSSFGYSRVKWSARVQALFAAEDATGARHRADA
jgi:hypothetical protein